MNEVMPPREITFMGRICHTCHCIKRYEDYSFRSQTPADKRRNIRCKQSICKECTSKSTFIYNQKNLVARRKAKRVSRYISEYGVSREEAILLADPVNREGRCPICSNIELLVVDHDHVTHKTRELICNSCNRAIGETKENLDTIYNMIAYLKKHRGV